MSFTSDELRALLDSLEYSTQRVSETPDTPYALQQEKLQSLSDLKAKIRQLLRQAN